MKIAIIGFGLEGRAAYDYWKAGGDITVCDQSESVVLPEGVTAKLGADYLKDLDQYDIIVRSPFVHPRQLIEATSEDILNKVTSNTNEFLRVCPTKNVIGITGTKGKGTTSTLTAKMLEAAGKRVHLGGNIGVPALELLKNDIHAEDWVVLELSSYQLIDLKTSPHIAACLMVVPEHLDWHEDVEEYYAAKQQLFIHQDGNDIAVFYPQNENSVSIADASLGKQIPYGEAPGAEIKNGAVALGEDEICKVEELKLLGEHNWQNVCAATTIVSQITDDIAAIRSVLTTFAGLPFRIEFRAEKDGVRYYNDSFATGPGAAMAAMRAIPGGKVVIIGGYDRGLDLSELAETVLEPSNHVKKVVLIGASADRTAGVFDAAKFDRYVHCREKDMKAIVKFARSQAEAGDAVVLSPSFASFDMFKNFEERGKRFNEAVEAL